MAVRMTEKEFNKLMKNRPVGKNKFMANKQKIDGMWFDSKGEYDRYCYLKMLEKTGEISNLRFHDKKDYIILIDDPKVIYIPDFCYDEKGKHIVEDFKGMQTKEFIIKKKIIVSKIWKGELDITFRLVKNDNGYKVTEEYDKSDKAK